MTSQHIGGNVQDQCGVCPGRDLECVWELPSYPLTEALGAFDPTYPAPDQTLVRCTSCGHVQLGWRVDPSFLYSVDNYSFSPVTVSKYAAEYEFLKAFLIDSFGSEQFGSVLEFGANNLGLARVLMPMSGSYTVCDPLLAPSPQEDGVARIPFLIEDALNRGLASRYDIILARHTLEHVGNPLELVSRLGELLRGSGIILFEVPSLRHMLGKFRLDAVTHQHLHYFTLESAATLARQADLTLEAARFNPHGSNGGSLLFALSKRRAKAKPHLAGSSQVTEVALRTAINRFKAQAHVLRDSIDWDPAVTFGFGASLMLATVNYHLGGALQTLDYVIDDDPRKTGTGYRNVNVLVDSVSRVAEMQEATLVITSWENTRQITSRLADLGAGQIAALPVS